MALISSKEITKAVFSASPLKITRPNTISVLVWYRIWPTNIVRLFILFIKLGVMPDQWKIIKIILLKKPQKKKLYGTRCILPHIAINYTK